MTPQKRKAAIALPAESSDESPYKRARSESTDHTTNKQNGTVFAPNESPNDEVEPSVTPAKPSNRSQAARGTKNEDAPLRELPQSWDQADTADQMLVKMKETQDSWARIEQGWERLTGAKPAEGMLPDRYRRLKDIMAHSKAVSALGGKIESKAVEEPLETSNDISALPTTKVGPSSPAIGGPSNTSGDTPKCSKPAVYPSDSANAAPTTEVAPEQDIPQSWEQANAGDQLIVWMKTSRPSWAKIEEAWQKLTGEKPAEGAIRDRYMAIKDLVIRPETTRAYKRTHPAKASNLDEASDHVISQRAKPTLRTPRKRKAKAEPSEESLDESSDESSDEVSRPSITTTRRKPRGAVQRQMRVSAFDGPSIEPISERTKTTAKEPSNSRAEAGSSNESDEDSKHSITLAKSAKRPRVKPAVAVVSGAQNIAETADEMVVEMRERGCSWVEISQAWTERTGRVNAPDTLRKRYGRIKLGSAANLKSATQASGKRKAKSTSPEEVSHDSSAKRSKPTAETPSKRNMDRGKRKNSVKYTDSTTDEDELFAAPVEPVVTASAKRNAGRTTKVNRSDPEWLVTNEKSPLACEDLHAEFSNPKTYENFTKSDWEDLRETLPPSVPINSDGYSIPMTFFKYDSDFRRGIREFQEDLASGRLDPKWQSDAAQAMEERARGEFDAYKEDQFEAFWGQKQKLSHDAVAGESMKIKLDFLIQNKVFKVGDYFSYSRVFGRGKNGVLVEKDCKIVKVDGKALTFAIPPGQRKYSRRMFESGASGDTEPEADVTMVDGDQLPPTVVDSMPGATQGVTGTETNCGEESRASENGVGASVVKETVENGNLPDIKAQKADIASENKTDEDDVAEGTNSEGTAVNVNTKPEQNGIHEATTPEGDNANGLAAQTDGGQSSKASTQEEDVFHSISVLTQLENKIVDVDGHFNSKDIPTQNAWRSFRGLRNNQDLGTLFEMREEFYVYKHPQIVKEAKRKR